MPRHVLIVCAALVACGGFLPFSDDDDDAPPPAPPPSVDAAADGASDASGASDGNGEAAVGGDGGFCVPAKTCVDDELECCSLQATRQTGCTMKCEIACCL